MGCGCGGGNSNNNSSTALHSQNINTPVSNEDCNITGDLLNNWKQMLTAIKSDGKLPLINVSVQSANMLLGTIQSGINYPDNYCYYQPQLSYFQTTIIPRIVEYVPEYIS